MKNKNTKICSKCKQKKPKIEFNKRKDSKDGLNGRCKECCKKESRKHYLKNKEKAKKVSKLYRENHKEEIKLKRKIYKQSEKGKATIKKYNKEHREHLRKYDREYRLKNSERMRRKKKEYYKTERGKKIIKESHYKYKKNNPEKVKAHSKVLLAIKNGKLIRPTSCPLCGNTEDAIVSHHNEGYSKEKQLVVQFMCHPCHMTLHRKLKNELTNKKQ